MTRSSRRPSRPDVVPSITSHYENRSLCTPVHQLLLLLPQFPLRLSDEIQRRGVYLAEWATTVLTLLPERDTGSACPGLLECPCHAPFACPSALGCDCAFPPPRATPRNPRARPNLGPARSGIPTHGRLRRQQ